MKQTPLHAAHLALNARMVDFAGWHMPIQYSKGIRHEHMAVREGVGLFDVSHMGEMQLHGREVVAFLRYATLNDPAKLQVGRAQYSMLPNDQGGLIDDIYIYRRGEEDFWLVCNAANIDPVHTQLQQLAANYEVSVENISDAWALLALQGAQAEALLAKLLLEDLQRMKKNRLLHSSYAGEALMLARTGYTGEDGFEIFCSPAVAPRLWQALLDAGAEPCGLGARDTLRLEAGFPLFGHELHARSNPLCTPFAWVVKDKDFYGRDAMQQPACQRRLVGLRLEQRGVPREGYSVSGADGATIIGEVSSGTMSPLLNQGIALAWLDNAHSQEGSQVHVHIRSQVVAATVVGLPFYR